MAELNSRKWRQKYRSVNVKSLPTGMTFFPEWVSKALHNWRELTVLWNFKIWGIQHMVSMKNYDFLVT